ncbi:MAG TPA: Ger(x)C family spore germination protein [Lysinibacillus sp.]|jgi:spore germination protein|uniref:Ger(x)C family spore germination protein n=1 Tax=unclassified Lysinibacillus TaxID=2636778 RepID=UPI000E8CE45C|nr:Ger(x)C family spore germination protein [Lysinibacillus sp. OF-1]WCH49863.1 Ger(x)C family spore germination protein [Lysinibacillus sp. OF-1]HBT72890.1 Ger(x)C family spore germination protein [Lysinibacillus sp.]
MNKLKGKWLVLLSIVFLYGCAQTNILDKVGLTTLVGYDIGKEEKIATTAVIREVNPEFQSNVEVLTTENDTSKGNRMEANRKLSKKIMVGQMRVILFGEELAKEDLRYYLDTNLENASVSNGIFMAVVEGEAAPLLKYEYKNIEDIGQHIFRLIEQNVKQEYMISSTLHQIAHDYYSIGKDLAMPILKRDDELVELSGVALFKGSKMVSTLPVKDSFYVKIVRDTFKVGLYETILDNEDVPSKILQKKANKITVAFDAIHSKREIQLIDADKPTFDLNIKIKSRVLEVYPDINQGDPKSVSALEKAIEKKLSKEVSRVIAHSQEVESDIFGFGEKYRSSVRHSELTKEKWHKMYKDMKVNVHVDFVILRNGVFE